MFCSLFLFLQTLPTKITTVDLKPAKVGPTARVQRRRIRLVYVPSVQRPAIAAAIPTETKAVGAKPKPQPRRRRQDPKSISARVLALRNEYKKLYVRPPIDEIPYNKNMVRQFAFNKPETVEQRLQRNRSSESSRYSRHCAKFIDNCVLKEKKQLETQLLAYIKELLVEEARINEQLVASGQPPIEFDQIWKSLDGI